ncbi:hypothetical protein OS493_028758 [Desmophyllum pertusum]|uniref:Uncharacterized protein n=1 Tax=Desmophyllum pertusum TaxID=174260 RepID=A0A9W9Y9A9_9CNID|nr:hypothetical protein OS493_028758 [Desmophyllum pertusum]
MKNVPNAFNLFNCDKTYNLDTVEKLLLDIKDDIKRKLNFDIKLPIVPPARKQESEAEIKETEGASDKQEQKRTNQKRGKSAENSSKIDVNIRKAPKIQRVKSKEEDDLETGDNIEEDFEMLENPKMPGQSGQSEQENDQETDTPWEMIYPDHDDKNVIVQQPQTSSTEGNSKDGTLVMKLRMRNGSILFKEKDAVWNEKWRPPDGLLEELSENGKMWQKQNWKSTTWRGKTLSALKSKTRPRIHSFLQRL